MIAANELVSDRVGGVVLVDSERVEGLLAELILSLVNALCTAEMHVNCEQDDVKISFEVYDTFQRDVLVVQDIRCNAMERKI